MSASRETPLTDAAELRQTVDDVITAAPVFDIHTHLFAPQFGPLNLWGIDELLTYHYLIAELFRFSNIETERFWQMTKAEQADRIWDTLFVRNTPLSEATRGVVAVLSAFGLDPGAPDLREARAFFRQQRPEAFLDRVLALARVSDIVMTNDPLDDDEARIWEGGAPIDGRFHAALRLDPLLNGWPETAPKLAARGFRVREELGGETIAEARRFLACWIERMRPLYLAVSLPDSWAFPEDSSRGRLLRDAVLPICHEHDLPLALMIGVRRAVNPALRSAGDGVGVADVGALERLCREHSDVRFLATLLARENQHALCVAARKFRNLLPFGCWWFLNNPSLIAEITRERLEMLGTSFIPQHSDARILDQLIYKWAHSRRVIADALYEAYGGLLQDGRPVTQAQIERDAARLFGENFRSWVGSSVRR